jgi:hypothetical protein
MSRRNAGRTTIRIGIDDETATATATETESGIETEIALTTGTNGHVNVTGTSGGRRLRTGGKGSAAAPRSSRKGPLLRKRSGDGRKTAETTG